MKLGIDFGTCFSFAATCIGENPTPLVGNDTTICDENNGIPTVYYNDDNNKDLIGKRALELTIQFGDNGIINIKDLLRNKRPTENDIRILGGKEYTIKGIVVNILKFLIQNAINVIEKSNPNIPSHIENLVIAVPAESEGAYRDFILECAIEATKKFGLSNREIHLIDEPVAAALSYYTINKKKIKNGSRILVYDLGGGTFDVAIVQYDASKKEKFIVLGQNGITDRGGNNWDYKLIGHIFNNKTEYNIPLNQKYEFREAIIKTKIKLSTNENTVFVFDIKSGINSGEILTERVSREKFESLTRILLEHTIHVVNDTKDIYIHNYGKHAKIDAIVLSGGSSQMPMVKKRLEKEFPDIEILSTELPDRAVAFGAAIYAANSAPVILVSPHTYGVIAYNKKSRKDEIKNILFKGKPIREQPNGRKYITSGINGKNSKFSPYEENQREVSFQIYETDKSSKIVWTDSNNGKRMFEVSFFIEKLNGIRTKDRKYTAEIRIIPGGLLEAHFYDDDQNGKEIKCEIHRLY